MPGKFKAKEAEITRQVKHRLAKRIKAQPIRFAGPSPDSRLLPVIGIVIVILVIAAVAVLQKPALKSMQGAAAAPTAFQIEEMCEDEILNQGETGIDCGGPCACPCQDLGGGKMGCPEEWD